MSRDWQEVMIDKFGVNWLRMSGYGKQTTFDFALNIAELEQKLEIAKKCIEFYANKESWEQAWCDDETFYLENDYEYKVGSGKRARATLRRIE